MKHKIKGFLQSLLGYKRYLKWFAHYKIKTLHNDKREKSFYKFLSLLNKSNTVLDIGANLGFLTYHLSNNVKQVYAFEPEPTNQAVLNHIVKNYNLSNVSIMPFALGDKNTTVNMVLPINGNSKEQGLSHVEKGENVNGINFKVDCKRLDDLDLPTINAIKIDVENFEFEVLKGGIELLKKDKPIIYCELWENENRENCFNLLQNIGYQTFVFETNKLIPYTTELKHHQNFFFK